MVHNEGNGDGEFQNTSLTIHVRTAEPWHNLKKMGICELIALFRADSTFKGKVTYEDDGNQLEFKIITQFPKQIVKMNIVI